MPILFKDTRIEDVSVSKGIVTSYWSAFDNMDLHGDIIPRGAYKKSISERGPGGTNQIKFLWMHMFSQPMGPVLHLEEDDFGLLAVYKVIPELYNNLGRDLLVLYNERVIDEHSVGIDVVERSDEDRRVISQAKLWEGSAVTWGANPLTPVVEMKTKNATLTGEIETPLKKQIDIARRALATDISDHMGQQIEKFLDQVKDITRNDPPAKTTETDPPYNQEAEYALKAFGEMSAFLNLKSLQNTFKG